MIIPSATELKAGGRKIGTELLWNRHVQNGRPQLKLSLVWLINYISLPLQVQIRSILVGVLCEYYGH